MRRLTVIVALAVLLGLLGGLMTVSAALAGRGHKWHLDTVKPFTLPSAFCGFKLRVSPTVNKGYEKLLKASDGSMTTLVTGTLRVLFTNLSSGTAITENATGPGKVTTHPDGSLTAAGGGHGLLILAPADARRFGLPTVSVTTGRLTASIAADGTFTSVSLHGHVLVNICTALS